jgi:ABC-type transporter Mla MlaB component
LGISIEQSEESRMICLEGSIGIDSAAELKSTLLDALKSGLAVNISLDRCDHLDVTAIQLLWAAGREAKASGTAIAFRGQVSEKISAALCGAGFEAFAITE